MGVEAPAAMVQGDILEDDDDDEDDEDDEDDDIVDFVEEGA